MTNIKQQKGAKSKLVVDYMRVKGAIKTLENRRELLKAQIEDHMTDRKTDILWSGNEYVEQTESPTVTVDAMKFKKLVSEGVFLSSVGVAVGKAKKVLSESEMKRITVIKNNTKLITGIIE
jgi:hypothetical protein